MERSTEAALPPLYAAWLREVAGGPIPAETVATCDACVMLPRADGLAAEHYFVPETKCCAFEPTLPNYLAGRILADSDAALARGRAALEERVARRVLAAPSGVRSGGLFRTLYAQTPDVFGRAPALRCPYLGPDGGCGVWRHRPGVCATWFCKHVRGQAGARFWRTADRLLRAVELDLSVWCIAELDAPATELLSPGPSAEGRPEVAELGGPVDTGRHGALWGGWEGREEEFYRQCARLVEPLAWQQVLAICGPGVRVLAGATRAAYERLVSDELPPRLRAAIACGEAATGSTLPFGASSLARACVFEPVPLRRGISSTEPGASLRAQTVDKPFKDSRMQPAQKGSDARSQTG